MKISNRALAVKPSATLAVTARAKAMRAQGVDILALSAGEPDFDTPDNIKTAAKAAIDRGESKYTPVPGTPALRDAVARKVSSLYGHDFKADDVIVSAGGKQVIFNACAAVVDPGDEVIFAAPYWVSYPDMVMFAEGTPIAIETDDSFQLTPEAVRDAITPRTKMIILNSPSNPTGVIYSREQLEGIAEVLRAHPDVVIVTDDIYEALVFDGEFCSIAHVAPDLLPRTLIAGGVSKTYAMTGWRIGYGIGPKELIGAMGRIQGSCTSGASSIAQAAATEALNGPQDAVEHMRGVFKERRDRIVDGLRAIDGIQITEPGGTFYVFPRVDAFYGGSVTNSTEFCEHLLNSTHLAAVPGGAFGADAYIRLSFACGEADIDEGLRRLADGIKALAG